MALSDTLKRVPEVYKAFTAFLTSAIALEGTVQALVESTGAAPPGWIHALAVGGSVLTGALTWTVRNKDSVDKVVSIIKENQSLAETLIADYKANNK